MCKKFMCILAVLFCMACTSTKDNSNTNSSILKTHLNADPNTSLLIDVRELNELTESGTITHAIHVPLSDITNNGPSWQALTVKLKNLQPNTLTNIGVFCRSGVRAGKAIERIKELGVTPDNLGGFKDLTNAGFSVTQINTQH